MKSEPESRVVKGVDVSFGLQDLIEDEQQITAWDGVRVEQGQGWTGIWNMGMGQGQGSEI